MVQCWITRRLSLARGHIFKNRQYYDFYYLANYTVIEMEVGPYLNAVYEDEYLTRYPMGENINFARLPYDLGILHDASNILTRNRQ